MNSVAKQNEILENITKEEEKFNRSNEFKMMLWIKNAYSKFEIKEMAEYLYPSLLKKIPPIRFVLENFEKLTKDFEILWWLWNKVKQISFVYIDLTKDISITTTLLFMIGINALIVSPTAFPSVVVMCLILTIVLPFLLSSLHLARDHPDIILGEDFYKQSRWRQVLDSLPKWRQVLRSLPRWREVLHSLLMAVCLRGWTNLIGALPRHHCLGVLSSASCLEGRQSKASTIFSAICKG